MQSKFIVALLVSCFALTVSASPVPISNAAVIDVAAREPVPEPVPAPADSEARACRLYACL
ncbi:hypothetical protein FB45DRAFT_1029058 [Roridomyces roridus]|uniref:Uncharacterized protein n=1 Tax=Roridomyces roridus TaxID=1738132 RepID=A0AAD7BSB4_9AGAR|nr:hypothetical protein FB45DRAFT_1029058 [Roridomyces roridus]